MVFSLCLFFFFFKWEVVYADEFDPAVSEEEIHDVGVQAAEGVRFLSRQVLY